MRLFAQAPRPRALGLPTRRRCPSWFAWVVAPLLSSGLLSGAPAFADEPFVHVVYKGQRLGSIAKRYNVSIDAICQANNIRRKDPIRPGQKLVIPGKTAPSKAEAPKEKSEAPKEKPRAEAPAKRAPARSRKNPKPPRKHTVYKGQRLGSIAKRYRISIDAICVANGIRRSSPIHPGDVLLIPGKGDDDGSYAAKLREKGQVGNKTKARSSSASPRQKSAKTTTTWKKYKRSAWKRGYINIVGFNASWKGYVIDPKGRVIPNARQKISKVLSATGKRPRIDARLISLIAKVSDTFGGRPMRIVSGYRERSYAAASRHRTGKALDFSIPGVPNEVLRDYVRTFDNVGVGFYPNSTFVHLDVRDRDTYWIDYSGPGEPPRKTPRHVHYESDADDSTSDSDEPTQDESEPDP